MAKIRIGTAKRSEKIDKQFEKARKTSYLFNEELEKSKRSRKKGFSLRKRHLFEVLTVIGSPLTYWGPTYNHRTQTTDHRILYSFDHVFNDGEIIGNRPRVAIGKKNISRIFGKRTPSRVL